MKLLRLIPVYTALVALILAPTLSATQTPQGDTSNKTEQTAKKKKAKKTEEKTAEPAGAKEKNKPTGSAHRAAAATASDSEIAAAKSSGKVWVNTETGVYHKGGKWYGATKQGKFMTEDDARKAGYRASKSKEQ